MGRKKLINPMKQCKALLVICSISFLFFSCHWGSGLPHKVTYTEHVAPVLYKHCTYCHRTGGPAHFPLENYSQAKKYATAIAFAVKERLMPPWPADPHYTEFIGQRVLKESEIALIEEWISDGMLEGPKDKMPAMPDYPEGSMLGKPDLVLPVVPHYREANSSDAFLLVKVPFELPESVFVSTIEFVPGNYKAVHHVNGDLIRYEWDKKTNVFEGELSTDMKTDSTILLAYEKLGLPNDDGSYPELQKSVVNYLPGVTAQRYPEGIGGYILPRKGAFLLNDLHYGPVNEPLYDSSKINLFFSKIPPRRPVMEFQLGTFGIAPVLPDLVIPPGEIKHVYSKYTIPRDISILTVNPHMHLIGKSFKAYALKPNGDTIRLISIPRWDFNWQYFYTFPKPVKIPAGSTIVAEGVYDNTSQNHNNPFSPPRLITDKNGSMKATDEMFQFIVTWLPYEEGDENLSLEFPANDYLQ
jgi:hypothetical protein